MNEATFVEFHRLALTLAEQDLSLCRNAWHEFSSFRYEDINRMMENGDITGIFKAGNIGVMECERKIGVCVYI